MRSIQGHDHGVKAARQSCAEDRLAGLRNERLRRHAAPAAARQPITAQPVAALLLRGRWRRRRWRRWLLIIAAFPDPRWAAQQPRVLLHTPAIAALLPSRAALTRRWWRRLVIVFVRAAAAVALARCKERGPWREAPPVTAHAVLLSAALFLVVIVFVGAAAEVAVAGREESGARVEARAVAAHALRLRAALLLVDVAHAASLRRADGVLLKSAAVDALPAAACLAIATHALCLAARLRWRWRWRSVTAAVGNGEAGHGLVAVWPACPATAELSLRATVVGRWRWRLFAAVAVGDAQTASRLFERDAAAAAADGFVVCAAWGRVNGWRRGWRGAAVRLGDAVHQERILPCDALTAAADGLVLGAAIIWDRRRRRRRRRVVAAGAEEARAPDAALQALPDAAVAAAELATWAAVRRDCTRTTIYMSGA